MNNCLKIEVSIPEGIEQLDFQQYAFNNEITKVILPKSLKLIGRECFRCCNNLRFVEFNKYSDLKKLPKSCFYNCRKLENVILPNSVESICNSCFEQCFKLKSLILPRNIKKLGSGAFAMCFNLEYLDFSVVNKDCELVIPRNCFTNCNYFASNFVIPEYVKYISAHAFELCNCDNLKLQNPNETHVSKLVFL